MILDNDGLPVEIHYLMNRHLCCRKITVVRSPFAKQTIMHLFSTAPSRHQRCPSYSAGKRNKPVVLCCKHRLYILWQQIVVSGWVGGYWEPVGDGTDGQPRTNWLAWHNNLNRYAPGQLRTKHQPMSKVASLKGAGDFECRLQMEGGVAHQPLLVSEN